MFFFGGGGGGEYLASENVSRRVQSERHSPRGRVLRNLSFQPCKLFSDVIFRDVRKRIKTPVNAT